MTDPIERTATLLRGSQLLRLFFVGFLALLVLIPVLFIGELVRERQGRYMQAVEEVSSAWGNQQTIVGPALIVPYTVQVATAATIGTPGTHTEQRHAIFLPDRLDVRGTIDSDIRKRGIFSVPVYTADLSLQGEFTRPDFASLGVDPSAIQWERSHIAVGISDLRAIQQESAVTIGSDAIPMVPGIGGLSEFGAGIHAVVGAVANGDRLTFSIPLKLNGSVAVDVVPFGRTTTVALTADYAHPGFRGASLPSEHTITADGFNARWSIPYLGRGYPQSWTAESSMMRQVQGSAFGVELVSAVDHYRMAQRSVKYAVLFILMTFATIWLVELLSGMRVHGIQYLMLGGALCLFYLLELSLSEHLGFPVAYLIASIAVVAMVTSFSIVALRSQSRAIAVGAGVAGLYAYLYLLLTSEDYALLTGSIGLFVALAAIMFVTRKVDWYAVGASSDKAVGAAQ